MYFHIHPIYPQESPLLHSQLYLSYREDVNLGPHFLVNLDPAAGAGFLHAC